MAYPQKLIEELQLGNVVPFIGSGLSIPSGYPSWDNLIRLIIDDIEEKDSKSLLENLYNSGEINGIDAPELHQILKSGGYSLRRLLSSTFNKPASPNNYHKLLSQLPCDTIITSNYDNLIEKQYEIDGYQIHKIWRDNQLPYYNEKRELQLLKIHGTIEDLNNLVISKSDYDKYREDNKLIRSFVSSLFLSKTILFLGFSLSDPNIISMLEDIRSINEGVMNTHYAALFSPSNETKSKLRRLGISTIDINGIDIESGMLNWIEGLIPLSIPAGATNYEKAKMINQSLNHELRNALPGITIRMRAALGMISNPKEILDNVQVYNSREQDLIEIEMGNILRSILRKDKRNTYRTIVHIDPTLQERKGYSKSAIVSRVDAMIQFIEEFGTQIQIAHSNIPVSLNQVIISKDSSFTSFKRGNRIGYNRTIQYLNKWVIKSEIENFDNDFDSINYSNKVIAPYLGIDIKSPDWSNEFSMLILSNMITELKKERYVLSCDLNGSINEKINRELAHKQGKLHKSLHLYFTQKVDNKVMVLLQKRAPFKDLYRDMYDVAVGGHQENEDQFDEIIREAREELGINLPKKEINYICSYNRIQKEETYFDNEIVDLFLTTNEKYSDLAMKSFSEEVSGVYWADIEDVIRLERFNAKGYYRFNNLRIKSDIIITTQELVPGFLEEIKNYVYPMLTKS